MSYNREAELAAHQRRMWPELLEAYDHRDDGLAAHYAFDVKLKMYAIMFHNSSRCQALAELRQAERALKRASS